MQRCGAGLLCVFETAEVSILPPNKVGRLTQWRFEEASLDPLLNMTKGLSQNSNRAADHLRSLTAAGPPSGFGLQLLQPDIHTHTHTPSGKTEVLPSHKRAASHAEYIDYLSLPLSLVFMWPESTSMGSTCPFITQFSLPSDARSS